MTFFRRFLKSFLTTIFLLGFIAGFLYLCFMGEQKTGIPGFYHILWQAASVLLYPEHTAVEVISQAQNSGQPFWQQLLDLLQNLFDSLHLYP